MEILGTLRASLPSPAKKLINLLIALMLVGDLTPSISATECFPRTQNLMPHVLVEAGPTEDDERYSAIAASWNDDFLIYGGIANNALLNYDNKDVLSVIGRMDIEQNTERWLKSY